MSDRGDQSDPGADDGSDRRRRADDPDRVPTPGASDAEENTVSTETSSATDPAARSPGDAIGAGPQGGPDAEANPFGDMTAEQTSLGYAAVYALLPGLVIGLGYLIAVPLARSVGLPGLVGLAIAALPGMLFMLGYVLYQAWQGGGLFGGAIAYTDSVSFTTGIGLTAGLTVWILGVLAVGNAVLTPAIIDAAFDWVPPVLREPLGPPTTVGTIGGTRLLVTAALLLSVNGLLLPVVEELYFRGYLLPRLDRFGWGAPIANAVLFGLYHLWAPWTIVTWIIASGPIAVAVWRSKSVSVAVLARVIAGLVGAVSVLAAVSRTALLV